MVSAVSFAAEAKANPTRYYRRPSEVVRDRRLKQRREARHSGSLGAGGAGAGRGRGGEHGRRRAQPVAGRRAGPHRSWRYEPTQKTTTAHQPSMACAERTADVIDLAAQRLGANGFSPLRSLKRIGTPGRSKVVAQAVGEIAQVGLAAAPPAREQKATNVGGRAEGCVMKRILTRRPLEAGGACRSSASPSQRLRSGVGTRRFQIS